MTETYGRVAEEIRNLADLVIDEVTKGENMKMSPSVLAIIRSLERLSGCTRELGEKILENQIHRCEELDELLEIF